MLLVRFHPCYSFVLLLLLADCAPGKNEGSFACGLAALSTPLAVQEALGRGQALPAAPWNPPDSLPVRMVAGALLRAGIHEENSTWTATLAEKFPRDSHIGHGVLVVDGKGNNHGILLFDGPVLQGAVILGKVVFADSTLHLIGVRMDSKVLRDPKCPIFGNGPE